MPAYVVVTREKTRNQTQLDQYKKLAPASFKEHPVVFRARQGRQEVLEGSAFEEVLILPEYTAVIEFVPLVGKATLILATPALSVPVPKCLLPTSR